MFNSQDYRRADEYRDRANRTHNSNEIREFRDLEHMFGELAHNAEWMQKNSAKILSSPTKGIGHQ
jgi:hypothetical protein